MRLSGAVPGGRLRPRTRSARMAKRVPAAVVALLATSCLLYSFYDRFWYPPDEGNYAHVAQRILSGETLNLQVQDVHPGYITFVNAAALRLFGVDLVSMRYPLVLAGLVQAAVLFSVFPRAGSLARSGRQHRADGARCHPVPQPHRSLVLPGARHDTGRHTWDCARAASAIGETPRRRRVPDRRHHPLPSAHGIPRGCRNDGVPVVGCGRAWHARARRAL